jgi:hypothetical protein
VEYKAGGEAGPGANRHTDPAAALGDVTTKPADRFVSLGAFGSLTVRVKGQAIYARGPDDVTVFVQPVEDLRPYAVEALSAARGSRSIRLGESAGTTASFGLAAAGVKVATEIRIVDLSGRTRSPDLTASESPGVSIRGIGIDNAALVSEEDDGDDDDDDHGHDDHGHDDHDGKNGGRPMPGTATP